MLTLSEAAYNFLRPRSTRSPRPVILRGMEGRNMDVSTLARLGAKHARNVLSETLYIHGGADLTKPVMTYALFNERCNVKCRQCNYWRLATYQSEMSIDEWRLALLNLKRFLGR